MAAVDAAGTEDWAELDRLNWDERAAPQVASPDCAVQRFVDEPGSLSDVVRFDLPRLPDLRGRRGVQLSPLARPPRR